jgi:AraC family transcriptional regulator
MPPKGQTIVASTTALGWDSVHGAILDGRIEELFDWSANGPMVLLALKGAAQLDWRRGNRFSRIGLKSGDVLVAPPGDCSRIRTSQPIELFCCPIGMEVLTDIADRGWPAHRPDFQITEGLNRHDPELWELGSRLAARIRTNTPGSRPAAEALQTLIAVHLLENYSTLARPDDDPEGLADHRLRPIVDYIHQNLCADVSLETLAGLAGLSPNYFLGAFREATGLTPHRYVTELRVARACELLRDPHRPITEVSLAVGFASQSHLTEVFRRTLKTTPAAYRREALGLSRDGNGSDP